MTDYLARLEAALEELRKGRPALRELLDSLPPSPPDRCFVCGREPIPVSRDRFCDNCRTEASRLAPVGLERRQP